MNLKVNGELREIPDVKTVFELLSYFRIDHKILVVELNRVIVDRSRYPETLVNDGDQVEIVHFVGGG